MKADAFLSRLEKVTGRNGMWRARCPGHGSRSQTLAIREAEDGRILLKCFAGCSAQEVVSAVGMDLSDLMPDGPIPDQPARKFRIPAGEVLNAISWAATYVSIAALDMGKGKVLSAEEREELLKVAGELHEAASYASGR